MVDIAEASLFPIPNDENQQEAHEAIRPTHIEDKDIETNSDGLRLYNLIWRRTIASQMAPAKINIQTIKIH